MNGSKEKNTSVRFPVCYPKVIGILLKVIIIRNNFLYGHCCAGYK